MADGPGQLVGALMVAGIIHKEPDIARQVAREPQGYLVPVAFPKENRRDQLQQDDRSYDNEQEPAEQVFRQVAFDDRDIS